MIAKCPSCGKEYKVGQDKEGKQARCACGNLFVLARPAASGQAPAEQAVAAGSGPAAGGAEGEVAPDPLASLAASAADQRIRLGPYPIAFGLSPKPNPGATAKYVGTLGFTASEMVFHGVVPSGGSTTERAVGRLGGVVAVLITRAALAAQGDLKEVKFRIPFDRCKVGGNETNSLFFVSNVKDLWVSFRSPRKDQSPFLAEAMRNAFGERMTLMRMSALDGPLKAILILLAVCVVIFVVGLLVFGTR
jgi:hypothetical protein